MLWRGQIFSCFPYGQARLTATAPAGGFRLATGANLSPFLTPVGRACDPLGRKTAASLDLDQYRGARVSPPC